MHDARLSPKPTATTSIEKQFARHSRLAMFTTTLIRSMNRGLSTLPPRLKANMTSPALPLSILKNAKKLLPSMKTNLKQRPPLSAIKQELKQLKQDFGLTTSAASFIPSGNATATN